MVPYLQYNNNRYEQNQKLIVHYSTIYEIPGNSFTKGKRYFEITHYEGNGFYLAGFKTDKGYAAFYLQGEINRPKFWLEKVFSSNGISEKVIIPNLSLDFIYTIGIGIDIDRSEFFVFHDNFFYSHNFTKQEKRTRFRLTLHPANYADTKDTVSINLGAAKFKYNIPNFNLLGRNSKESCRKKSVRDGAFPLIEIIVLVTNKA